MSASDEIVEDIVEEIVNTWVDCFEVYLDVDPVEAWDRVCTRLKQRVREYYN